MLRRILALALVGALLAGCPDRHTAGDGGASTPSSWTDTAHVVVRTLSFAIPAVRLIATTVLGLDPSQTAEIGRVIDTVANTTLPGFTAALDAYENRGGDRCVAQASAGALTESLLAVTDTLGGFGWDIAPQVRGALGSLGALTDVLLPACTMDAGPRTPSEGDRILLRLARRPATLRPFPELPAEPAQ